jgi:hypothetical protein
MKIFGILKLELPTLKPEECKIHLACWNGRDDPMDIFLRGLFTEWQNWQSNRNFERPFIVSLIKMYGGNRWLFAGVYSTNGCNAVDAQVDRPWDKSAGYSPTSESQIIRPAFRYDTKALPEFVELTGRLIVEFARPGRQSYLKAENWAEQLKVHELRPRPLEVEDFPGFSDVLLPKWKLDLIIREVIMSWKSALSSVAGIYLITDTKTGRHYVGSAYGEGGIWGRWKTYSETGHGFDKILQVLLKEMGTEYARHFQFCILETADTNASKDDVIDRETHWKNALCCREAYGGYNAN